jgi:hypothetical protein
MYSLARQKAELINRMVELKQRLRYVEDKIAKLKYKRGTGPTARIRGMIASHIVIPKKFTYLDVLNVKVSGPLSREQVITTLFRLARQGYLKKIKRKGVKANLYVRNTK